MEQTTTLLDIVLQAEKQRQMNVQSSQKQASSFTQIVKTTLVQPKLCTHTQTHSHSLKSLLFNYHYRAYLFY